MLSYAGQIMFSKAKVIYKLFKVKAIDVNSFNSYLLITVTTIHIL